MRSSVLPKCKPKITRISVLQNKQTRILAKKIAYTHKKITKKSGTILVCMVGKNSLQFLVQILGFGKNVLCKFASINYSHHHSIIRLVSWAELAVLAMYYRFGYRTIRSIEL